MDLTTPTLPSHRQRLPTTAQSHLAIASHPLTRIKSQCPTPSITPRSLGRLVSWVDGWLDIHIPLTHTHRVPPGRLVDAKRAQAALDQAVSVAVVQSARIHLTRLLSTILHRQEKKRETTVTLASTGNHANDSSTLVARPVVSVVASKKSNATRQDLRVYDV